MKCIVDGSPCHCEPPDCPAALVGGHVALVVRRARAVERAFIEPAGDRTRTVHRELQQAVDALELALRRYGAWQAARLRGAA